MSETFYVSVLLDQNLTKPLDYSVPSELQSLIQIGTRVEVPLRKAKQKGTVAAIKQTPDFPNVRPIFRLLSEIPELSAPLWKLAHWMAHYYATPLQKVLRCFIPPNVRREVKPKSRIFLTLGKTREETIAHCEMLRRKHPSQALVLDELLSKNGIYLSDLLQQLSLSRSPIDTLLKQKWLLAKEVHSEEDFLLHEEFFATAPKTLNAEQRTCLEAITGSLKREIFATHLLFGITGSGKTEVYLQAIQAALDQKKSVILLVPEISLTSQTIERFRSRFPHKIAILHHRRSLGERTASWEQLQKGDIQIVIGARSAIFSPVQNLGLILVDEEHDNSYKQSDEAPCYHARDVAVMRGSLEKAVVVLGSATPSIESRYNAEIGKYHWHTLPARATSAQLPKVRIVDMKEAFEKAGGFTHFCPMLIDGISDRLKKGEQTLLFFNRRGYHRTQFCAACRTIVQCPHCDLSLTFHRKEHLLRCHLCDFSQPPPTHCPSCHAREALQFKGFGTEHVERTLHALFPEVRTLRMDRDTTRNKHSHEELFRQFRAHKADVLIGTQMIAKGFHFPAVTLVGVLNADAALSIPDFRSPEQVFQLLTQVAGRSGRSELPGEVIFQTFMPQHPVIRLAASQDYSAFYAEAIEERRLFGYPPFCHLIKCTFSSKDPAAASAAAHAAHAALAPLLPPIVQLLPPLPCGHPKIKDLYRFQFLLKTLKISSILPLLTSLPSPSSARLKIDVDPQSTFF